MNAVPPSFKHLLVRKVVLWSIVGTSGAVALALALSLWVGKVSMEENARSIAEAAAKAFRPQILTGDAKFTQLQIADAFHLQEGEYALLRDPAFKIIYDLSLPKGVDTDVQICRPFGQVCWHRVGRKVSTLVPIYFDSAKSELYGYLEVGLTPKAPVGLLAILFAAICGGLFIQLLGLSRALLDPMRTLSAQLSKWAERLHDNPKTVGPRQSAPFLELQPLEDAMAGLTGQIEELEQTARDHAKNALIRGIGHDILTPVSQLKKYHHALVEDARSGISPSSELTARMERSMRRLESIARQLKVLRDEPVGKGDSTIHCDVVQETEALLSDLKQDEETLQKGVSIQLNQTAGPLSARVTPGDYQRIVDNLVHNAIHASRPGGRIDIQLSNDRGSPRLSVRDHGAGIPEAIRDQIFDVDFTTRPGSGTGLGLAIVRTLCRKHRAQIALNSTEGHGTEFSITFEASQSRLTEGAVR